MENFRPVAFTASLCKCMQRVVAGELPTNIEEFLYQLQFAYKLKQGVEGASLNLLKTATRYLDLPNSFVRILFMDFTSAFNTRNIYLLLDHLQRLQVNATLMLWIKEFLKDRSQHAWIQI